MTSTSQYSTNTLDFRHSRNDLTLNSQYKSLGISSWRTGHTTFTDTHTASAYLSRIPPFFGPFVTLFSEVVWHSWMSFTIKRTVILGERFFFVRKQPSDETIWKTSRPGSPSDSWISPIFPLPYISQSPIHLSVSLSSLSEFPTTEFSLKPLCLYYLPL